MTKKQLRKIADEIIQLDKVYNDEESTHEQKARAEKRMSQITNMLMCLPNGLELLDEVDYLISKKYN